MPTSRFQLGGVRIVAGADHEKTKTNDVGQAVRDLIGRARINYAGGEPSGDAKALFDFSQS
jgi:hypothetical protein